MRSVPFFFRGTVRHIRFTFAAVEDIDQLMPDGFLSVFEREAGIEITHLLLWAGLSHESVSYEEVGDYLSQHSDILSLWRTLTYSFLNDEWLSLEKKDPEPGTPEPGDTKPLSDIIKDLEKRAVSDMNLLPRDFYGLTPREFNLLLNNYGLRENQRTGIICATMANIHARKSNDREFEPKDFIRVGEPEKPQDATDQAELMGQIMGMM